MVQFLVTMGQNSSLPKGRRKSLRSFGRKSHNHTLSHTFHLNDSDDRVELLNINQASEEELMTLPGVNREVARSIVEHRKAIGRFRRLEDLALVRGIGADKLEQLKPEICVSSHRRNASRASSRAQSYDSLRSTDSRSTVRSARLINLNRGNVFELQGVHGITQEIAAAIVHYREKRGPFKKVEDLLKVKGIDRMRLDNISRFLSTDSCSQEEQDSTAEDEDTLTTNGTTTTSPRPSVLTNGFHKSSSMDSRWSNGAPLNHHLSTKNGLSSSSLLDIFELLSAYSPRPILEEVFDFSRNGEAAVRIGSWNLNNFTVEKASNPGVREVVCRTILENGLSIVAVQEVLDVTALKLICEELNKPRLRRVCEWKDKSHMWNFCMLDLENSHLGFIYDSDGVVDIEFLSLSQGPEDSKKDCEVLIASFRIGDLNVQLINLKLSKLAKLEALNDRIKSLSSEDDLLLVCADFSSMTNITDDWLTIGNLRPTLPFNTNTNYLSVKSDSFPHHISNFLYNSKLEGHITGISGVVRQGLTHLAIPNGWNWGGPATPYCPIWTEVFVTSIAGTAL